MKQILRLLYVNIFLLVAISSHGQSTNNDYKMIDDYVKSLGPLDTLNMGTISFIVTKKFPDNKDKVRAIFDWIAYNISFDLKAGRNNDNEKTSTDLVLKNRKATAAGYAGLFQGSGRSGIVAAAAKTSQGKTGFSFAVTTIQR